MPGTEISKENFSKYFHLAIPLLKGQLSCREVVNGLKITADVKKDEPLLIHHVDGPYAETESLRNLILSRGIDLEDKKKVAAKKSQTEKIVTQLQN